MSLRSLNVGLVHSIFGVLKLIKTFNEINTVQRMQKVLEFGGGEGTDDGVST